MATPKWMGKALQDCLDYMKTDKCTFSENEKRVVDVMIEEFQETGSLSPEHGDLLNIFRRRIKKGD